MIWAILCQGPPELVNGNFLIPKQFFHTIFPKTLKFLFSKMFLIIFINYGFFLCLQKNQSSFCSRHDTAKGHCEFVEFGGKLKQYTRIGSSSILLPRNNARSHGIKLVLLWNVKILRNLLKLIISLTLVLFSTRILTF